LYTLQEDSKTKVSRMVILMFSSQSTGGFHLG